MNRSGRWASSTSASAAFDGWLSAIACAFTREMRFNAVSAIASTTSTSRRTKTARRMKTSTVVTAAPA
jgi:hypothetical protein